MRAPLDAIVLHSCARTLIYTPHDLTQECVLLNDPVALRTFAWQIRSAWAVKFVLHVEFRERQHVVSKLQLWEAHTLCCHSNVCPVSIESNLRRVAMSKEIGGAKSC